MQSNQLQSTTRRTRSARVGRGGKRGKTAGRGTKGQKARAGHKIRPEIRDQIKKIPKRRGHGVNSNNPIGPRAFPINLSSLETAFSSGDEVSPSTLRAKGLLRGERPKILADGDLTKKLTIKNCLVSATAKAKIEKAGGAVK